MNIKVNGSSRSSSPEKNLSSGNELIFPSHHISSTTNSGGDFTTGFIRPVVSRRLTIQIQYCPFYIKYIYRIGYCEDRMKICKMSFKTGENCHICQVGREVLRQKLLMAYTHLS